MEPPTLCTFLVLSGCWVTSCDIFQGELVWDHSKRFGDFVEAFANSKSVFYIKTPSGWLCFIADVVLPLKLSLSDFKLESPLRSY